MQKQPNLPSNQTKAKASQGLFSLGKGMMLSAMITGYILGPLVMLGVIGYFLDKLLSTKHLFLFLGLALAFISSNMLIYKCSGRIASKFTDKNHQA